jgi:hypothetical protein
VKSERGRKRIRNTRKQYGTRRRDRRRHREERERENKRVLESSV